MEISEVLIVGVHFAVFDSLAVRIVACRQLRTIPLIVPLNLVACSAIS